jgi:hypothetical protein
MFIDLPALSAASVVRTEAEASCGPHLTDTVLSPDV